MEGRVSPAGGDGRKGDPVLTYLTVLLPSNRGRLPRPTQSNSLATKFTVSGNRKMPKSSRITMECSPIRRIHSFANVAFENEGFVWRRIGGKSSLVFKNRAIENGKYPSVSVNPKETTDVDLKMLYMLTAGNKALADGGDT
nr:uncharacterized protein LOC109178471 [Ipomoea batatas]